MMQDLSRFLDEWLGTTGVVLATFSSLMAAFSSIWIALLGVGIVLICLSLLDSYRSHRDEMDGLNETL